MHIPEELLGSHQESQGIIHLKDRRPSEAINEQRHTFACQLQVVHPFVGQRNVSEAELLPGSAGPTAEADVCPRPCIGGFAVIAPSSGG